MRIEGWEDKLHAQLEAARSTPYKLGQHDCLLWVVAVVLDCTGQDFGLGIRGKYKAEKSAYALIRRLGGDGTLRSAVTAVLERQPVPPLRAKRADPVLYVDEAGKEHLGVCTGATIAVLGPAGLLSLPLPRAACGWNV